MHLDRLPNQERDEHVQLFLRRHWIFIAEIVLFSGVGFLLPIILYILLSTSNIDVFAHPLFGPLNAVALSIYLFMVFIVTITQVTDYYLDTWIVTNERIINIEQHGLFSRIISELHLNQVQDVTSEIHGVLATFVSYGNVYIQTAGTRERFNFKGIDNPDQVKEKVSKLIQADKLRHGDASHITT